ncbi:MAG: hypothetical protein ABDI07_09855 [Candidatus Kryptonium sp.]
MIIKFNLLPKEKIQPEVREKPPIFLKVYTSFLLFTLIILAVIFYNTHNKIVNLTEDKKKKEELLNKYKKIAIKVKEMEKENEEVKRRIEIIISLKEAQGKNLKNLASILSNAQVSKLLFSGLRLDSAKANVKGLGLDMDFLALYMQHLENNKEVIKSVTLKTAQQKTLGDLKLVEFELEVNF